MTVRQLIAELQRADLDSQVGGAWDGRIWHVRQVYSAQGVTVIDVHKGQRSYADYVRDGYADGSDKLRLNDHDLEEEEP